ncbi:hypothetical protein [Streptomyces sp. NPDC015350]|uniref:hypothetical protein n=1 Tax=Streptomyces sp. NPDC015350 TaxID=3364955 RepID=UPI0037036245
MTTPTTTTTITPTAPTTTTTITPTAPTTAPTAAPAPAPAPTAPPATQQSVRALWAAIALLGACCALYVTHEHPVLVGPVGTVGTLLAAGGALAALLRR